MTSHTTGADWARDAFFYHLYPLGAFGAPGRNDQAQPPTDRLEGLHAWLDPIQELGANAVLLGPVLESGSHGYDTADLFTVDRRLGDNAALARWSEALHRRGMRLALDAVFHHVGREFWAFRDVRERLEGSAYRDWFHLDFSRRGPHGDPFAYEGWNGHYDLVKLNTGHPAVREHLFSAVRFWIETFGVDGLRLDAADALDLGFQRDLAAFCRSLRPDFWLMGEVVRGDYRHWANPATLASTTNYELYKGLYSSHNDRNYFEVAHTLTRQFGAGGLYENLALYTFADNHDVERVASRLVEPAHLYPLHALLFTVPGVPSLYYGSEWGLEGRKEPGSDAPLRPALAPADLPRLGAHPDLHPAIARLAALRRSSPALRRGAYEALHVDREQLVFLRSAPEERVVVAVNAAAELARVPVRLAGGDGRLVDLLNEGAVFKVSGGEVALPLDPRWARVLRWEPA